MCLSIPGKVTQMDNNPSLARMGKVDFGGVIKDVSLAYVPEVKVGDYVIVHVGFAIGIVDEEEAKKTFQYIAEMEGLEELNSPSAIPTSRSNIVIMSGRPQVVMGTKAGIQRAAPGSPIEVFGDDDRTGEEKR